MKNAIAIYLIGCGDALSQLVNKVAFNGHPNESLSGRSYREGLITEKWIDALFFWQDRHCKKAYENDVLWSIRLTIQAEQNE